MKSSKPTVSKAESESAGSTIEFESAARCRVVPYKNKSKAALSSKLLPGKWIQKQSVIKTIEGEFKVKMWSFEGPTNESSAGQFQIQKFEAVKNPVKEEDIHSSSKIIRPVPAIKEQPKSTIMIDLNDSKQVAEIAKPKSVQKVGKNAPKAVPCTEPGCEKSFRDKSAMRKHLKIHGPKQHFCLECGKAFVDASKLKRHFLVHTKEKIFECPNCEKKFGLEFNLRAHIKIHLNQKDYICPIPGCPRRFVQSANLKSHMITHNKQQKMEKGERKHDPANEN